MDEQAPAVELPILHVARVVLEAKTPLSIGTGSPDSVFDTALVRDANNLPAIPGTSLAGVLRALSRQAFGASATAALFGYQNGSSGFASRIQIGWGCLLNSEGRAARGLLYGEQAKMLNGDPLFKEALRQINAPVYRNRVRLTHREAAAGTGKFDRTVLPAGYRFAVEVRLSSPAGDETDWQRLVSVLTHPGLRLGGATRAGLGRMECVAVHCTRVDLRNLCDVQRLGALGADPSDVNALQPLDLQCVKATAPTHTDCIEVDLALTFNGMWRIGSGHVPLDDGGRTKPADLLPVTERRVVWEDGRKCTIGTIENTLALLLPASSLKGVLAHRMTFHANRFARQWASTDTPGNDAPRIPAEVCALMGELKSASGGEALRNCGYAGCLFLEDVFMPHRPAQSVRVMHNSIDRFTGGVRKHMLFEEQNVFQGNARVRLLIDLSRLADGAQRYGTTLERVQQAFVAALTDLCEGRLALGSRSTSGNGFLTAPMPSELSAPWSTRAPAQRSCK